ncbi:TetR/AcrR family transcriptional regulator [Actinokineospora sp. NBRC 105648]|uniref:TetR/AcrR family transcriptional regulator n=1 Tax=Actinokineospora sp. NBRC 105648 TaxID=3032206 RepID=UPI0024A55896|nr:TetR/AcrR family transcriptional regulator [Actinokineospora sp. NBRC 105648]GLZ38907.1 TetR family transcriptional regulator [Actinokineospora sp. NBRC 105648]
MTKRGPEPLSFGPLPRAERAPVERADAARNRDKILRAAAAIFRSRGAEGLSIAEVARAADIGVGTIYRRFGDRSGLLFALLDEREREFQEAFFAGPPPLGPGGPAAERLGAFAAALVDRVAEQLDLLLLAETSSPGARFRSAPYTLYHTHLTALFTQARPGADAVLLADSVLAAVSARQVDHLRTARGRTVEQIKAGVADIVAALCARREPVRD